MKVLAKKGGHFLLFHFCVFCLTGQISVTFKNLEKSHFPFINKACLKVWQLEW